MLIITSWILIFSGSYSIAVNSMMWEIPTTYDRIVQLHNNLIEILVSQWYCFGIDWETKSGHWETIWSPSYYVKKCSVWAVNEE